MTLAIAQILVTIILGVGLFFLGWQFKTFTCLMSKIQEQVRDQSTMLMSHVTDYTVHKQDSL